MLNITDTTHHPEPVAFDVHGDPVAVTPDRDRLIEMRTRLAGADSDEFDAAIYLNPSGALALADALRAAAHSVLAAREKAANE